MLIHFLDRMSEADAWKTELKDMLKNMETQIEGHPTTFFVCIH